MLKALCSILKTASFSVNSSDYCNGTETWDSIEAGHDVYLLLSVSTLVDIVVDFDIVDVVVVVYWPSFD